MLGIAVVLPYILHAVIDNVGGTRAAEKRADRKAMHHTRGDVDAADLTFRVERIAGIVEIEESALGIQRIMLEKGEEGVSLGQEPVAVIGAGGPVSKPGVASCRCHDTPPISCTMPVETPI